MKVSHRKILLELLSLPTSPLNEHYIIDYIRRWAAGRPNISLTADPFGNLRLRLRQGRIKAAHPFMLTAHMDHPGFEAVRMTGTGRLQAIWRGGVSPEYFKEARVRFFSDNRWVRGKITRIKCIRENNRRRVDSVSLEVDKPVAPGAIGMWDLPNPRIRHSRIHARGCDDIAGTAAILCALSDLAKKNQPTDIYALFTRGEEIGFTGAIAACQSGIIPKGARLISVETSSEIIGAKMGNGPILRVGDRSSIFNSTLTALCRHVAEDTAQRDRRFCYQRKLMDAGTCESTVFCEYGHQAAAVCLALGNYHNMNIRTKRIAAEYIDINDFSGLVKWFVALTETKRPYSQGNPQLQKTLQKLSRKWLPQLKRTAPTDP